VGGFAVAAVGFGVYRAVNGDRGGASSPEAAVEALAAAIEAEDPVAALATMNPEEVEALGEVYSSAAGRARRLGFAPRAKTFGGVEVTLDAITYSTEDIGPDAARVTITGGRADLAVDRRGLADATEAVLDRSPDGEAEGDTLTGELAASDLAVQGDDGTVPPFLVVVARPGGWYVSPLFTAAQYAVDTLGLAAPTLPPPDAGDGAADPEAAVRDLLVAAGGSNAAATGALATGEAGAVVRAHRRALEVWVGGELGTDTEATIDTLDTEVSGRDEGGRRVVVTALAGELTWNEDDEEHRARVAWDGECLSIDTDRVAGDTGNKVAEGGDEVTEGGGDDDAFCLTESWGRFGVDDLAVVVAEDGGGWRVDPLATLADYAAEIVPELTETSVLRLLGYPELAEATAELAAGSPTTVALNDAGYAVANLDVRAGESFTVSARPEGDEGGDDAVDAFLVTPDGDQMSAYSRVEPESSGTYRLVVGHRGFSPGEVQLRVSNPVGRPLALDEATLGAVGRPDEVVDYTIDLDAERPYEITFDRPDLDVMVLDPDRREIELTELGDDASFFESTEGGAYVIRIDGGFDDATGSFQIGLREQDDLVLGNGTTNVAAGTITPAADAQFIGLTVLGGRTVVAEVVPHDGVLDPVVVIRDPSSDEEIQRVDEQGSGEAETVVFAPGVATAWRVEVQGADRTVGSFSVEVALED
jgi:hypothetical protein